MKLRVLLISLFLTFCMILPGCKNSDPAVTASENDGPQSSYDGTGEESSDREDPESSDRGDAEPESEGSESLRERLISGGTVIHAGGAVIDPRGWTFIGANCLEGLTESYAAGDRFIEIDFNFTSDGKLVCIHDWEPMYSTAIKGFDPLTEEEYLSSLVYEAFTPMSLGMLAEFMTEHDDLCIVTDIKDRNVDAAALIAEEYPELQERFIIQIYSGSEYDPICELGYENIIFTLYALDWNSKTDADALVEYAKSHKLFAYTIPASLVENEEYLSKMKGAGVPLLVHTVNGEKTRRHYLDMGISAVYTDYGLGYDDPPEGIH